MGCFLCQTHSRFEIEPENLDSMIQCNAILAYISLEYMDIFIDKLRITSPPRSMP